MSKSWNKFANTFTMSFEYKNTLLNYNKESRQSVNRSLNQKSRFPSIRYCVKPVRVETRHAL